MIIILVEHIFFTFINPGWGSTHASFAKPEIRDPDPLAPKLIAVPETVSNKPSWLQEWVSLMGLLRGDSIICQKISYDIWQAKLITSLCRVLETIPNDTYLHRVHFE